MKRICPTCKREYGEVDQYCSYCGIKLEEIPNRFHKEAVKMVKACGRALIDNAEKIIGGYEYQTGDVDITITINEKEAPVIRINQEFLPESFVKENRS